MARVNAHKVEFEASVAAAEVRRSGWKLEKEELVESRVN